MKKTFRYPLNGLIQHICKFIEGRDAHLTSSLKICFTKSYILAGKKTYYFMLESRRLPILAWLFQNIIYLDIRVVIACIGSGFLSVLQRLPGAPLYAAQTLLAVILPGQFIILHNNILGRT